MTIDVANPGLKETALRAAVNALLAPKVQQATTGTSPITINPNDGLLVNVTTGGTGDEIVFIDCFPLDENFMNLDMLGKRIIIRVTEVGAEGDKLLCYGGLSQFAQLAFTYDAQLGHGSLDSDEGYQVAAYAGNCAVFEWQGSGWVPFFMRGNMGDPDAQEFYSSAWLAPTPAASQYNYPKVTRVTGIPLLQGDQDIAGPAPSTQGDLGVSKTEMELTTGETPIAIEGDFHIVKITTGGTAGVEEVSIGDPGIENVGFKKKIVIDNYTNPADTVSLSVTNIKDEDGGDLTSIIFADPGTKDNLVIEAKTPTEWRVWYADAGVVTAA